MSHELTLEGRDLYCSFCGKSQHEAFLLIRGPSVQICDECVALCCEHVVNRRCELLAEAGRAALAAARAGDQRQDGGGRDG